MLINGPTCFGSANFYLCDFFHVRSELQVSLAQEPREKY